MQLDLKIGHMRNCPFQKKSEIYPYSHPYGSRGLVAIPNDEKDLSTMHLKMEGF
jgi:hypothetical protein